MKGALNGLDPRRLKTWLIVGTVAAVLLLLSGTLFSGGGTPPATPAAANASTPASQGSGSTSTQSLLGYQRLLSSDIAAALSQIQGAGQVTVSLDLHGGPSWIYAFNQTTHRTDTAATSTSGASTDTQTQTQLATAGTGQSPVLTQELAPKVVGVLIVATGAKNPMVREELTQAAQALLGLPAYAIEVLPGGGGR